MTPSFFRFLVVCLALPLSGSLARGEGPRSLSLPEALRLAEEGSEDLEQARESVLQARLDLRDAWASLLPSLGVSAEATRADHAVETETSSGTLTFQRQSWLSSTFSATLPLIQPVVWGEIAQEARESEGVRAAERETIHGVLYGVAELYCLALASRAAVEGADAEKEAAEAVLKAITARVEAGVELALTRDRAESDLLAAEGSWERARVGVKRADLSLARALGLAWEEGGSWELASLPILEGASGTGEVRGEVEAARFSLQAARLSMRHAGLTLIPEVSAWFNATLTQNTGTSGDPSRWYLGLDLTWSLSELVSPFVEGARRSSQVRSAEAVVRKAERETELAVRDAWLAVQQAEADQRVALRRESLAQRTLDATLERYRQGAASALDTSTAVASHREAVATRLQADLSRNLALLEVLRARGVDLRVLLR